MKLNRVEEDKATHYQIGKYQAHYSTPTPPACSSLFTAGTLAHQVVANTQTLDCPHHSAYMALVSTITLLKLILDVISMCENSKILSVYILQVDILLISLECLLRISACSCGMCSGFQGLLTMHCFYIMPWIFFPVSSVSFFCASCRLCLPLSPMPLLFVPYNKYIERTVKPS